MKYQGYLIIANGNAHDIVTVITPKSLANNVGHYIDYKKPEQEYYAGTALVGQELFDNYDEADEYLAILEMH